METLATVCREDPELLLATSYKIVDVTDPASQAEGVSWWAELTGRGGEAWSSSRKTLSSGAGGVLPSPPSSAGAANTCGSSTSDYTTEENLSRLRSRSLSHKRSLALGEFALGVEGLERLFAETVAASA